MRQEEVEIPTLVPDEGQCPHYASEEAAGADARAHLTEALILEPGSSVLVPTGLKLAIPAGYEIQVRPRSGLALKHQVSVLNTPGTIDSDYRGEIGVIIINHGKAPFIIEPNMRIAQFVLSKVYRARFVIHEELVGSTRGEGGFGSTGKK